VFFDSAYQGFGSDDTHALRTFAEGYQRVMLAQSFSKNFSLYGERVGCLSVLCADPQEKQRMQSVMKATCLPYYSNPPIHGARIVELILSTPELRAQWQVELMSIKDRLDTTRAAIALRLDWPHLLMQKGMFAYSGLKPEQIERLRNEFSIYMPLDGRISIASINPSNLDYICDSISKV
jgi:aspartate aminotransferase, mitochondrial